MDDMIFFASNKKRLHQLRKDIEIYLKKLKLTIKGNWQVYKVDSRPVAFCGYKFYRGYTNLKGTNSLRIRRRINKISKKKYLTSKDAAAVISYYGMLKHTDSYNFYKKNIEEKINIEKCKEVVSNENRKRYKTSKKICA